MKIYFVIFLCRPLQYASVSESANNTFVHQFIAYSVHDTLAVVQHEESCITADVPVRQEW